MRGLLVFSFAALVVPAIPAIAEAGRTPFGRLLDTEVMPERGAEIQSWIFEENGREVTPATGGAPLRERETWWSWAAVVGATDRLELSLPVDLRWRELGAARSFTMKWYGVEARYRFASPDRLEAPPFVPLVRLAVKRDVTQRALVRVEADAVASYRCGRIHAGIDLGGVAEISRDDTHLELRPGAGISVQIVGDLRLGAEFYAELSADDQRTSWAVIGPNLAWTHGRLWLSATYGVGLYQIDNAPRFIWGIMF